MAIIGSELKLYKSVVVNDTTANGSLMSTNEVVTNVLQNFFPHVFKAERTSGSTKYRKGFLKNINDAGAGITPLELFNPMIWIDKPTKGDDYACLFEATQIDTQADIVGTETKYGVGGLDSQATAAGYTATVLVPDNLASGNDAVFRAGDTVRLADKPDPDSGTGNEELLVIDTGGVSVGSSDSGTPVPYTDVTLTFTTALVNTYAAWNDSTEIGGRVMSVLEPSSGIVAFADNFTDASSIFDEGNYPIIGDNIGSVEETITITFSDANSFTAVGSVSGSLGGGNIATDFQPTNADYSKPLFTLDKDGWGTANAPAGADVLVFDLHPASFPIWEKLVVPADCGSLANNKIVLVISGESA